MRRRRLSECVFGDNFAILVHDVSSACTVTDVATNFTQPTGQTWFCFAAIVSQCCTYAFVASKLAVNLTYNQLRNNGIVMNWAITKVTVSNVFLTVTQLGTAQYYIAPFYSISGSITNYEAVLSFSTDIATSIAMFTYYADIKHAKIQAPTTASKENNKMMLFYQSSTAPLNLLNITAIDFVQSQQIYVAVIVGYSQIDITATDLTFENAYICTTNEPSGILAANVYWKSQTHVFTNLQVAGTMKIASATNPQAGLLYGTVELTAGNTLRLEMHNCQVDLSFLDNPPASFFGNVINPCTYEVMLQDTTITTNIGEIPCTIRSGGVSKPVFSGNTAPECNQDP